MSSAGWAGTRALCVHRYDTCHCALCAATHSLPPRFCHTEQHFLHTGCFFPAGHSALQICSTLPVHPPHHLAVHFTRLPLPLATKSPCPPLATSSVALPCVLRSLKPLVHATPSSAGRLREAAPCVGGSGQILSGIGGPVVTAAPITRRQGGKSGSLSGRRARLARTDGFHAAAIRGGSSATR